MTTTQVTTTVPAIKLGELMISADRKSTPTKPLSESQRVRRIVLPESNWSGISVTLNNERSQALNDILREQLKKLAGARLRDLLDETNDQAREVNLSDYGISQLLTWSDETASSKGGLTFTRDDAQNWFDSSATKAAILAKHGETKGKIACDLLRNRFGALAAKNHGLAKSADAAKMLALIAETDMAETNANIGIITEVMGRLTHIHKALTAKEAEATFSMDDI